MKILMIIAIAIVVILLATGLFLLSPHLYLPKRKDFSDKLDPRIQEKPDIPALTVEFSGDPDRVISEAYKSLFMTYYRVKGAPKGPGQPAPLARYRNFSEMSITALSEEELRAQDWVGFVAIPVPAGATLPTKAGTEEYPVELAKLEYGTVAEIIHLGPYAEEHKTIRLLLDFIEQEGYRIIGLHEEEYLRGPGVPLVRPESYITAIRYRVEKR